MDPTSFSSINNLLKKMIWALANRSRNFSLDLSVPEATVSLANAMLQNYSISQTQVEDGKRIHESRSEKNVNDFLGLQESLCQLAGQDELHRLHQVCSVL